MKFSIVIPFYNNGKSLDTLELVLNDYKNDHDVEIIFVEDRGKDEDYLLLLERFDKNHNVKIYRNSANMGPAKTRIKGIKEATGEYIFFLDADDGWCKHRAYNIYEICISNTIDIIGGSANLCDELKFEVVRKAISQMNKIEFIDIKDTIFFNPYSTSSVCVRREVILNYLFDENMRYAEDIDCWRRIILSGSKAALLKSSGTYLFKHAYLSGLGLSSNTFKMTKGALFSLWKIMRNSRTSFYIKFYCLLGVFFGICKGAYRELKKLRVKL